MCREERVGRGKGKYREGEGERGGGEGIGGKKGRVGGEGREELEGRWHFLADKLLRTNFSHVSLKEKKPISLASGWNEVIFTWHTCGGVLPWRDYVNV